MNEILKVEKHVKISRQSVIFINNAFASSSLDGDGK